MFTHWWNDDRRRRWLRRWRGWAVLSCGIALLGPGVTSQAAAAPPSVIFIGVDDLNDWVGCLGGHPQARTPHLDRLAARGTVFLNAHCQAPLCNPSRTSLLTGLRPTTTGIYGLLPGLRAVERTREVETLPQCFRRHGYSTFTCGKIFHDGSIPPKLQPAEFETWGPAPGMSRPKQSFVQTPARHPLMDWGPFPERDEEQADWKIADAALGFLKTARAPFLLACGFRLPHVPCFASAGWFAGYGTIQLPEVPRDDRRDVPPFAWNLHWKLPEPRLSWLESSGQWRPLVHAYLASVAFMDSQVGRVLTALEASPWATNTVVVVWSDNGWHLGEKGITGKNSLWERSTRVPLVMAGPGISAGGRCVQPVELLDLFPTLAEWCGLKAPRGLEGRSLGPQLRRASAPRKWPAITTANPGNHAVRSERWRYIRYADGSEELYDLQADPHEWTNLVQRAEVRSIVQEHRAWLPRSEEPHAPGSAQRVLTQTNGVWFWEGEQIDPAKGEF